MANEHSKRAITRIIKDHRDWLNSSADGVRKSGLDGVESELAKGGVAAIKVISVDLEQLSMYHAIRGLIALIDGLPDGWHHIDTAVRYRYWCIKLNSSAFFKQTTLPQLGSVRQLTYHTRIPALLLCYSAVVAGLEQWQAEMSETLVNMAAVPGAVDKEFWQRRTFEPFVMRLFQDCKREPASLDVASTDYGPYASIIAHWDNASALQDALLRACDYHCQNMIDKGGEEEFDIPPFDLYPIEILAIYRVRERLGLTTPTIDHPLLSTPLASVAARDVMPVDDAIIPRVEKLYLDVFGGATAGK